MELIFIYMTAHPFRPSLWSYPDVVPLDPDLDTNIFAHPPWVDGQALYVCVPGQVWWKVADELNRKHSRVSLSLLNFKFLEETLFFGEQT